MWLTTRGTRQPFARGTHANGAPAPHGEEVRRLEQCPLQRFPCGKHWKKPDKTQVRDPLRGARFCVTYLGRLSTVRVCAPMTCICCSKASNRSRKLSIIASKGLQPGATGRSGLAAHWLPDFPLSFS